MSFFIECAIRVTLILAVAFAISLALRKQSAAVRHLVWMVAFAVALVTPFLAKWGPQTVEPVTLPIAIEVNAVATGKAKPPARQSRSFPFEETALAIWAAGVLVQAIRAGRGVILANSLKRSAWPIDSPIDIPEPTSIAESESAAVAMTLGVRQPLILLPPRHREWHPSKIRAVLLHELAHIRRRDCLLQWLPQAVCALHWFNPLAWFARAQ